MKLQHPYNAAIEKLQSPQMMAHTIVHHAQTSLEPLGIMNVRLILVNLTKLSPMVVSAKIAQLDLSQMVHREFAWVISPINQSMPNHQLNQLPQ